MLSAIRSQNMLRHRPAELRRVYRGAHIERLKISVEKLERPCLARHHAHSGVTGVGDKRRQCLQRHAQSNEAHGRRTRDADVALGADEEAGVAAAHIEFATALTGGALAGQVHAKEDVVASAAAKSRAALSHAVESSRHDGDAREDALCNRHVRPKVGERLDGEDAEFA
jgi:hypothetical protein